MKIISINFLHEAIVVGRVTAGFQTRTSCGAAFWTGNLDPFLLPAYRGIMHCQVFSAEEFVDVLRRIADKSGLAISLEESGDWEAKAP